METKYNSFLFKKSFYELFSLLEGNLIGSERFINLLSSISNKEGGAGDVSYNLYRLFKYYNSDLKKIDKNYFDLEKGKNDKVSFIRDDRVKAGEDGFNLPGRSEVKIGRLVRYLLDSHFKDVDSYSYSNIKDSDIEDFVNVFKFLNSEYDGLEFVVVDGSEIKDGYNEKNYNNSYGSLGGSCMNNSSNMLNIYVENESVKLLLLMDVKKGEIHGRAILWDLIESPCVCKKYMDRIYVNRDHDKNRFIKWADENSYMYRKDMKADNRNNVTFIYNNETFHGEIKVKLEKVEFNTYPYLDTLCFLNLDNKTLSNLADQGVLHLQDTSGNGDVCYECGGELFIESEYYDDYLCEDCGETHIKLDELGVETKWNKK